MRRTKMNANETSVLRKMKHLDEGSGGLGNEQQRLTGDFKNEPA